MQVMFNNISHMRDEDGTDRLSRNVGTDYHFRLCNIPEEHRSQNFSCSLWSWKRVNNKKTSRWRKGILTSSPFKIKLEEKQTGEDDGADQQRKRKETRGKTCLYKPRKTKRHNANQTRLQIQCSSGSKGRQA